MKFILGATIDEHWRPGIGDPTIGGWLTVAAYGAAVLLTYLTARTARNFRLKCFWLMTSLALAILGINKQLDLQSWITEVGRSAALAGGWYEQRASVQRAFVIAIAFGGLVLMFFLAGVLWRDLEKVWLAISGIVLLVVFVLIRAMSFHHVDQWIETSVASIRINWLLELGGITAIAISALLNLRGARA